MIDVEKDSYSRQDRSIAYHNSVFCSCWRASPNASDAAIISRGGNCSNCDPIDWEKANIKIKSWMGGNAHEANSLPVYDIQQYFVVRRPILVAHVHFGLAILKCRRWHSWWWMSLNLHHLGTRLHQPNVPGHKIGENDKYFVSSRNDWRMVNVPAIGACYRLCSVVKSLR